MGVAPHGPALARFGVMIGAALRGKPSINSVASPIRMAVKWSHWLGGRTSASQPSTSIIYTKMPDLKEAPRGWLKH